MKILIDLTSLADNFSGIERFAACISHEMINCCDDSFILIFKDRIHKMFEKFTSKENIKIVVLPRCNKLFFSQIRLLAAINREEADVYMFPAFPAPFFLFKKNAISTIHDLGCWDCPSKNKRYMTLYFRIMYWKAALGEKKIVTVSEFSKGRISEVLKKDVNQIEVIYDGISDCFQHFDYSDQENEKAIELYHLPQEYILCLSTLEPRKNMRLLIDAYNELLEEKKIDIDLVLAGRKGWLVDDLLNNLNENTVRRIHFTGFVDDQLLPYVYSNSKLFVFPSLYEGFGIPPLEAMACGVPVISSDAASMPEILGNAAFYFQSNNLKDLKEKIIAVLSLKSDEIYVMKENGIVQSQKFNWHTEAIKLRNSFDR